MLNIARQPLRPVAIRSCRSRSSLSIRNYLPMPAAAAGSTLAVATQYLKAWRAPGPDLESKLKEVVAPDGMLFKADGIVHLEDRLKTIPELAAHIRDRHAAYKHLSHQPFAMAASEAGDTAFLGVCYSLQHTGQVAGQEATGRISSGVLLEQLGFDKDGLINCAFVCRQLTAEEVEGLTHHPGQVRVPELEGGMLDAPQEQLTGVELDAMRRSVERWVHCWDSDADLAVIDQVLDPAAVQVAAYGLGKHRVPFQGLEGARQEVQRALGSLQNTNTVVAMAMCSDRRAGFVHWRANSLHTDSHVPEVSQGMDFLRFNKHGQISLIFSFTMRPYKNVVKDSAPRADGVD
ncbi:hypothetical protein V8C86DRAFT_2861876 [Haematococcus lacustris]